jgi:hypothetical protein
MILLHSRWLCTDSCSADGWVLLIRDDAEQARVLLGLITSVAFLALRVAVKPLKQCGAGFEPQQPPLLFRNPVEFLVENAQPCHTRQDTEDRVLATMGEVVLAIVYLCVLMIKTCELSPVACKTYGFGGSAEGAISPTVHRAAEVTNDLQCLMCILIHPRHVRESQVYSSSSSSLGC